MESEWFCVDRSLIMASSDVVALEPSASDDLISAPGRVWMCQKAFALCRVAEQIACGRWAQ